MSNRSNSSSPPPTFPTNPEVAQQLSDLLQCFPAAAIGGVQWKTLLQKYEEGPGIPRDLGSTDLRLLLSFETVKMCSKTCFWQTRWKFHAVGQEGCKSKSRAQQLLSYCNAFSGISVESLWVWVKPDLNPKCGSNCSCHRILTVVSVHQCATRSCQVKNGSRQSILLVRQSISESWSQRFRA